MQEQLTDSLWNLKMPLVSTILTTQAAALVNTSVALSAALFAAVTAMQINPDSSLWSVAELRLACIAGSILGGIAYVSVWPDAELNKATGHNYGKMLASRYATSCITGILASPGLMLYFQVPKTIDTVLLTSGMTAFLGVATLTFVAEQFTEVLRVWLIAAKQWFLGKFFPIKNSENQDRRPSMPMAPTSEGTNDSV